MRAQFGPPVAMTELRFNTAVDATEIFDADGDGDHDLVLATARIMSIRFNEGGGLFSEFRKFRAQGNGACDLAHGDLDGDGDPDLVEASTFGDSMIVWFANNGAGEFSVAGVLPFTDANEKIITLADMDEDGDMDICSGSLAIRIYPNNGLGVFGFPQNLGPTLGYAIPADLDQDGDMDLLGIGESSNEIAFRENLGGTYGAVQSPGVSLDYTARVLAVDLDLDGDSDLVGMKADGIVLHMNLGGLAFGTQILLAPGVDDLRVIRAADLTGDGAPELVVTTSESRLLTFLNNGGGTFTATPVISAYEVSLGSQDLHIVDVEGDGELDAMCNNAGSVHWQRGGGDGTFGEWHMVLPYSQFGASSGDMDNDGDLDVLMTSVWVEQTEPGVFTLVHTITANNNAQAAADLNGDGLMDTYTLHELNQLQDSIIWCRNLGDGSFQRIVIGNTWPTTTYMEPCDLDADGDLDLVRAGSESAGVICDYRNDGAGIFTQVNSISSGNDQTIRPAIADFDGDGDKDVACHEYQSPYFSVFENVGAPEMQGSPQHLIGSFFPAHVRVSIPGDIDGDGDQDVLLTHNDVLYWYANNGLDNTWTSHTVASNIVAARGTCDLGDIDADGDLDVMYRTADYEVCWRLNNGTGTFGPAQTLPLPPDSDYEFDLGDLDLDGDADLILMAYEGVDVYINTTICDLFIVAILDAGGGLLQATPGQSYQWFLNSESIPGADQDTCSITGSGMYTVEVTSTYGCTVMSEPYFAVGEPAPDGHTGRITLVPNPASSGTVLQLPFTLYRTDAVQVVDVNGRVMRSIRGNGTRAMNIERDGLDAGIYVLRIINEGSLGATVRLVLE